MKTKFANLLTIDIGTSQFKAALWDFEGNRLAFATFPLASTPDGLRHEADAMQWLQAFEQSCAVLCGDLQSNETASKNLSDVQAIVISGNGPSLVPIFGTPVIAGNNFAVEAAPARLWLDRRADSAAREVSALFGAFVDPCFFLPKILGIKNDEPALYEKTRCFVGCPEFLAYALTGEARTVFPSEGFDRWFWNDAILSRLQLDAEKFPPFIRPGEVFGVVLPPVAERFGLPANIPVVSGGPDFFAAILGAGVIQPGQVCNRSGTSEGINVCTARQITDTHLMSYGHPVRPHWNLSGTISTTGRAVQWGKDLLGLQTYEEFYSLAAIANADSSAADTPVFLPYLAGERAPIWNTQAKGVIRNLSLSTGRPEFASAILEGICFAVRDVITVMENIGANIDELRVTGAGAHHRVLNQLRADITGKEVLVPVQKDAELLGLAIIGSCYLQKYNSLADAAKVLVQIESRWQPNKEKASHYAELFAQYKETYNALNNGAES